MKNATKSTFAHVSAVCLLVLGLCAPAWAFTYSTQYEMDVDPSTGAGVRDATSADANGNGLLSVGAGGSGSTFSGGVMHFVDNSPSGNMGYYFNQATGGDIAYTVDISVKANNNVNGNTDATSMGFNGGPSVTTTSKGRGLRVNNPGGGICTTGSAQLSHGASNEGCVDLSTFHHLRITVNGAGNGGAGSLNVYDLDAGVLLLSPNGAGLGSSGFGGEIANGGFHLGSMSGSTTTQTDFELEYVRVLLGTAVEDGTTVITQLPAPACSVAVTPVPTQTVTGYQLGATPAPSPVVYTVQELGTNTVNYTAAEVDALGVPTNYPWMTLSPTSGSLAGGASTSVTATLNTTSLPAGAYTGYVKIGNDCTSSACLIEPFSYNSGATAIALVGQGTWTTGSAAAGEIGVKSNEVHMLGGSGSKDAINAVPSCTTSGSTISVKFKIKSLTSVGNTSWTLWMNDANGNQFGRFYGTDMVGRGRDHANTITPDQTLTVGVVNTFEVRIFTASNQLQWFFNGNNIGNMAHNPAAGDSLGTLRFERVNNAGAAGEELVFDDLEVTILDEAIRRIDLNVVGCALEVQDPKFRWVGPCRTDATTTEVFTIKNIGSADWTGYTGFENPEDDDWMTVSYTSAPVVRFNSAPVNATIDWSQVPITGAGQNFKSRIRFGGTCDGGSNFVFVTLQDGPDPAGGFYENVNVTDTTPAPLKIIYNGDVTPSDTSSAGTGFKFQTFDTSVDQGTIVNDGGVGQASDGLAYLITDTGSAKTKWRSVKDDDTAGPNIDSKVGATAMARVKVDSASGVSNSNLYILESTISAMVHYGGANNVVRETIHNSSATVSGDNAYHTVRVTSKDTQLTGTGIVIKVYIDENPTPVLTLTNVAGDNGGSGIDAIGFGTASTVDSQTIYFDWVSGTNAGAFAPGEEVSCVGSLIPSLNCNTPKVDIDGDHDVDMDDFGEFQKCFTGTLVSPPPLSQTCDCFDNDNDNDVDTLDFNHFVNCETGASIAWATSGLCPN